MTLVKLRIQQIYSQNKHDVIMNEEKKRIMRENTIWKGLILVLTV